MMIKDIMIREVITVSPDTPVVAVANLLIKHDIHAVPVVDNDRKVLGLVSETDFFLKNSAALHLPTYVGLIKQEMKKGGSWEELPELQTLMQATAKDIMTADCVTLPEVADVRDLLTLVQRHHYKTFPITDHRGTLVGVVTLIDAIAAVDALYKKSQGLSE